MLKLPKRPKADLIHGAPLSLYATDGILRRTFDHQTVSGFRRMMTELAYSEKLPQRITIASALRGEGVTYTTLALATTFASDMVFANVCVVDLNWWAPGLIAQLDPAIGLRKRRLWERKPQPTGPSATEQLAGRPGFAQVLDGSAQLDEALLATTLPNLKLLPAGEIPVERRPVVARSAALKEHLETLSKRFDYLLLDVPAILTTSDAIALASLGEACCLVVRHGVTSTASVQRALDDIKHLRMLGVILNQVSIYTPAWIRAFIPQE